MQWFRIPAILLLFITQGKMCVTKNLIFREITMNSERRLKKKKILFSTIFLKLSFALKIFHLFLLHKKLEKNSLQPS